MTHMHIYTCGCSFTHTGVPPEFTANPEDQFVFERDADGNAVNLVFNCPVTGSGPPNITWSVDTTCACTLTSSDHADRTLTGMATAKHCHCMLSCEYTLVSVSPGIDQGWWITSSD